MDEQTFSKLGLKSNDFDGRVTSTSELVETILTSGRLFRKTLQQLIIKDLRTYYNDPHLDYSDNLGDYVTKWKRKKQWNQLKDFTDLKIPKLRTTNLAITLMIAYFALYVYLIIRIVSVYSDFLVHVSLSGISLAGLILLGAMIPLATIFHFGQTELPAKTIDGFIDKIMQENMYDLLTSDKAKLKLIIERELTAD